MTGSFGSYDFMPRNAKVKRGCAAERNRLVKELREHEGDHTMCIVAFVASGRKPEEQAKIDESKTAIERITARLQEITTPRATD